MNPEFFIARRIARAPDARRPGVMVRIAVISVALSVAVMLLALAVITGFKREVTRKLTGFAGHVEVTDIRSVNALETLPVAGGAAVEKLIAATEGFASMAPYAVKGGIVKTSEAVQGVQLRGVDGRYDWSFFAAHLREGGLPRVGDTIRTKDVLISRRLADKLERGVGDKVEMLFVESGSAPRRDRFRIAGIYSTGMDEMDDAVVMTDLRNVQRLSGWAPDRISGYTVQVADFDRVEEYVRTLDRRLLYEDEDDERTLTANSVVSLYPNIFDWLKAHDVNAAVIIGIMLAVAFFNMASALLILVMERTRMIGLLKAMGMTDGAVQRLFLYRAAFIILRGLLWGNLAGGCLCAAQRLFGLVKLDPEGYLLSELPVAFDWGWWLMLNAGVMAVIVVLLTLPAYMITSVKPDESIRYE